MRPVSLLCTSACIHRLLLLLLARAEAEAAAPDEGRAEDVEEAPQRTRTCCDDPHYPLVYSSRPTYAIVALQEVTSGAATRMPLGIFTSPHLDGQGTA